VSLISRRNGSIVNALGPWSNEPLVPQSTSSSTPYQPRFAVPDDPSFVMMQRARSGYSMNPDFNIQLLSTKSILSPETSDETANKIALLHLWSWIERVETISSALDENDGRIFSWPAKGMLDSGVWQLLGFDSDDDAGSDEGFDHILFSETLNCNIYDSHERRAALAACGWAAKFDLSFVMAECEQVGELERSAALALWHGNIDACVDALKRNADSINKSGTDDDPSRYTETLNLTAMCIAGFGGKTEAQMRVWKSACESLLQRNDFSASTSRQSPTAYLRGMCQFLLKVACGEGISVVLEDSSLSLCDRVALACRFLPQDEMKVYLVRCMEECNRSGNLEGLVVTGLSKSGIGILQTFVDRHVDIQTASLIVSRVVIPAQWTTERKVCVEWVELYRNLLNTWQMWETRAMFDVERAELLRTMKSRDTADGNQFNQQRRIQSQRNRPNHRSPVPDVLSVVPAQIEVRCNYCSSPLSLKQNQGVTNAWLSKMQPLLNCCPQCRKPLPRCSVCLLSMSALNPYTELMRERRENSSAMASLSSQNFAEWWSWCTRCRHGGHSHHLLGWFSVHKICPVSGCDCQCEFGADQL
jgi:WD repeat-containing protein mio